MKRIALILFSSAVIMPAHAQAPGPDAFRRFEIGWNVVSYSRQESSNLYGGNLSFAVRASTRFGVVSEVGVHDTISSSKVEIVTYRFGPRLYGPTKGRMTPFAEILAGGSRATTSFTAIFSGGQTTTSFSSNGFAFAAGGGLDVRIKPWFAWRAIQSDYSLLRIEGETSNGVLLATGIVFRFGS
jgi:hypothetical protein